MSKVKAAAKAPRAAKKRSEAEEIEEEIRLVRGQQEHLAKLRAELQRDFDARRAEIRQDHVALSAKLAELGEGLARLETAQLRTGEPPPWALRMLRRASESRRGLALAEAYGQHAKGTLYARAQKLARAGFFVQEPKDYRGRAGRFQITAAGRAKLEASQ